MSGGNPGTGESTVCISFLVSPRGTSNGGSPIRGEARCSRELVRRGRDMAVEVEQEQ